MKRHGVRVFIGATALLLTVAPTAAWASAQGTHHNAEAARTVAAAPVSAPVRYVSGPHPRLGTRDNYTSTSSNWAGYDVVGNGFSSVRASWVQPSIQPDDSNDYMASFWVGLDGDGGSATVEQLGTQAEDDYGSVTYTAWWEMYDNGSNPEVPITSMAIRPGDLLTATVTTDGAGGFTLSMSDETTGSSFHTAQYSSDAQDVSAEIVAEAPTDGLTGDEYPLPYFGTVDFTDCAINGLPLADFDWNQIDMVDPGSGATLASTSALGADGASFAVANGAVTPMPPTPSPTPTAPAAPPVTSVAGGDSSWHRSPVTLTFTATDQGGPGVKYTDYSIDGGAWVVGTSLTIPAPANHSNDGIHTIAYSSTDNAGEIEAVHSCRVRIDTRGPACAAKNVTVSRGKTCRLYFKVHDALSSKVTNVLEITRLSGAVKRRWSWGYGRNFSGWWWISYHCTLPQGTYLIRVYGKDLAGNAQSVVGKAHLRVH